MNKGPPAMKATKIHEFTNAISGHWGQESRDVGVSLFLCYLVLVLYWIWEKENKEERQEMDELIAEEQDIENVRVRTLIEDSQTPKYRGSSQSCGNQE